MPPAQRQARAIAGWLCLLLGTAAACAAPAALAVRGHVLEGSFGAPGSGPGQFKEPSGVANDEATGRTYVVDKGNNRLEWFKLNAVTKHEVLEGEITGSSATGEGKLASGSKTIESPTTTTGAFSIGQEIAGEHIPAATTITKVGPLTLEISNPAEATGIVTLTAKRAFSEPEGITVDNTCPLHELKTGKPLSTPECETLDPSNSDIYIADHAHAIIDKFKPTPAGLEYLNQITETPAGPFIGIHNHESALSGIANGTTGELWAFEEIEFQHSGADNFNSLPANEFTAFRELAGCGFLIPGPGYGVDREGDLYVNEAPVCKFTATGELLEAVDTEKASGVAVELSSDDVYVDNLGTLARFEPQGELLERLGVPGGHGSGVAVDSTRNVVSVADSTADVVDRFVLEEAGTPTVQGESFSEVSSASALFTAQLNPRGESSEYRFEYGRCASLEACAGSGYEASLPTPEGLLPADYEVHHVSANPQDLLPGTAYHFRVAIHNTHGTAHGEAQAFVTQGVGGELVLPDAREWELVSPPDKHGAVLEPIGEQGVIQAAGGGGAITYLANAPTEPHPEGYTNSVQVLSTRGPAGWSSHDILPPNNPVEATSASVGQGEEYRFFSEDLTTGVLQPFGAFTPCVSPEGAAQPCLSPQATEQTAFLRNDTTGAYTPLVTGANVAPGTHFGEEGKCPAETLICGPRFVGASPDAKHVILTSKVGLTEGPGASGGLYEWAAGQLTFIGGAPLGQEVKLGRKGRSARHAVSADGSRVIFEGVSESLEGLLMHDLTAKETLKLDLPEAGCGSCGSGGGGVFQVASLDGSRVFFTSEQRLTEGAGAEAGKPDLYVYDLGAAEGKRLTDLTPLGGGVEPAGVQGSVLGASERGCDVGSSEGCDVYFVANGVQGENPAATHGTCGENKPGDLCNLYVVRREGSGWGQPRLVAVLSEKDFPDWDQAGLNLQPARVSPSGGWLAFMSRRSLTGYDNEDVTSKKPGERVDEEVFLYDAGTGGLACASCNPTGARPAGVEYERLNDGLVGGDRVWPKAWIAGNVPGWTPYALNSARYQSRYLSDTGRLFFDSSDGLVPADVNGVEDVYEFEPVGVGPLGAACGSGVHGGRVVFKAARVFGGRGELAGCVGLISSGESSGESGFLDASANGGDVYFLTSARLVGEDTDTSVDVYDAHECSGESPCFPAGVAQPPSCSSGDSCKAAPSPQPEIFGAPASALFSGVGNLMPAPAPAVVRQLTRAQKLAAALRACRKKPRRARPACEKHARRSYGPPVKAKKATSKPGRGGR